MHNVDNAMGDVLSLGIDAGVGVSLDDELDIKDSKREIVRKIARKREFNRVVRPHPLRST